MSGLVFSFVWEPRCTHHLLSFFIFVYICSYLFTCGDTCLCLVKFTDCWFGVFMLIHRWWSLLTCVDICSYLFMCTDVCWYLLVLVHMYSLCSYMSIFIYMWWYLLRFVDIRLYLLILTFYLFNFMHIWYYLSIFVDICFCIHAYAVIFIDICWRSWFLLGIADWGLTIPNFSCS